MQRTSKDDRGKPVRMSWAALFGSSRREPELQSAVRRGRVPAYQAVHRAWQVAFAKFMGLCTAMRLGAAALLIWLVPAMLNSTPFSGSRSMLVRCNELLTPGHTASPSGVAYVAYGLYLFCAFALPSVIAWLLWPCIGGRVAMQRVLLMRACPACDFSLREIEPQTDGCIVCPECGSAWRVPDGAIVLDADDATK